MVSTYEAMPGVDVLTSAISIPGLGQVPVNAFVLHGPEPMLVDTGAVVDTAEFMETLRSVIDPADLRWIWLTHTDPDHIGSLHELMTINPDLRVITTFLAVGIMGLFAPLPMDRIFLLNPGEKLAVSGRTLTAIKPPVFDNPCTTGFVDDRTGAFFSSDCFGALLSDIPESAADLTGDDLRQGQMSWTAIDSPWIHKVDKETFARELDTIRALDPTMVLSSHLPAAPGSMMDQLLAPLAATPAAEPFVGPNQPALEAMLAAMAGASADA